MNLITINKLQLIQLIVSTRRCSECTKIKLPLDDAIKGIKQETKKLRQRFDVMAQALTLMEASNKIFYEKMLTGIDGLKNAVEKQSEDNQIIIEMIKAGLTQAKK